MVHGSISGAVGIGPMISFGQGERVNSQVYSTGVLPWIKVYAQRLEDRLYPRQQIIVMEDNASIHNSMLTNSVRERLGLIRMPWPANSPDLNPIENIWCLLKHRIDRWMPRTTQDARYFAIYEWNRISLDDIQGVVRTMQRRCEAVIAANGGHTQW
jgi:transposase